MSSSHELTVGLQNKTRSLDSMHWNECIQDPLIQLQKNVHVQVFILSSEVVPSDQHSWGTGLLEALFSYLPAAPSWVLAQGVFFSLVTSCCKGAGSSVDYRSSLQRENLDLANVWGKILWIIGILHGRFPGLELTKYCTLSFGPTCKLVGESMVKYTEKVVYVQKKYLGFLANMHQKSTH